MAKRVAYMINDNVVTTPTEEVWTPIVLGIAGTSMQKRSPYWQLEWRLRAADCSRIDWFTYDNTVLTSLTTRPSNKIDTSVRYTDVICQQVTMRQALETGTEVVARFLVYIGA